MTVHPLPKNNLISPPATVTKSKTRPKQKSLSNFINETDEKKKNIIDRKLLKFLIFNKINLNITNCVYLQDLLHELRPSYIPAEYKDFYSNILDQEYDNVNKNLVLDENVVLSINQGKKNVFIATVKQAGQVYFISSDSEVNSLEKFEIFVQNTVNSLQSDSNVKVKIVISDHSDYELSAKDYWFFKCFSVRIQSLSNLLLNDDIFLKINEIVEQFQIPSIKSVLHKNNVEYFLDMSKNDFKSFVFNLESVHLNWNTLKNLAIENDEVLLSVKHKLIDKQFYSEIEQILKIIDIINNKFLSSSEHYMADVFHIWLELKVLMEKNTFKHYFDSTSEEFIDMATLAAYYLHPSYNYAENLKYLPDIVTEKLHDYLVITFNQQQSSSLHAYEDKIGIFKTLFDKQYTDPHIFWRQAGKVHPDFYKVCRQFIDIPAFSNCWSENNCSNISLIKNPAQEKKIEELFYRLQIDQPRLKNTE